MSRLEFNLESENPGSMARAATFKTLHNEVQTPIFMPVGTHGNVRNQKFEVLEDVGAQILLANTYHLHLKPGPSFFKSFGDLHKFTSWKKSFLTDSGGFQIFCMPQDRKITEEGAKFKSYLNGDEIFLSPEQSIETQMALGSDIMMVLDECVPSTVDHARASEAMQLTHRWALRSLAARKNTKQSIFGIIQGACYKDLRSESANFLTQHPFDGFAIGGLAVGESKDEREEHTAFCTELMPKHLPRYLMGVGTPIDLLEAVHRGVDMFDCIIPTAHAEQGLAYTFNGKIKLYRSVYKHSEEPIEPGCKCSTCKRYSRAFLHHLFKSHEQSGSHLVGIHNLHFYQELMRQFRKSILEKSFLALYNNLRSKLAQDDPDFPTNPPIVKRKKTRESELGDFKIVQNPTGQYLIASKSLGETMHSVNDPNVEAKELYLKLLLDTMGAQANQKDWVVWDVGLGAAHNAMSLIHHFNETGDNQNPRNIELVSFENNLDALKLVLFNPGYFPHICHAAPNALLKNAIWNNKAHLSWRLVVDDFWKAIEQKELSKPNVIFWDPFSSQSNPNFWTREAFTLLKNFAAPNATLSTYSSSTLQRIQMLLAGWYVYEGPKSGPKESTTRASISPVSNWNSTILTGEFLEKLTRSEKDNPKFYKDIGAASTLNRLKSHPQFL